MEMPRRGADGRPGLTVQRDQRLNMIGCVPIVVIEICDGIESLTNGRDRADCARRVTEIGLVLPEHDMLRFPTVNAGLWGSVRDKEMNTRERLRPNALVTLCKPILSGPVIGRDNGNLHSPLHSARRARCFLRRAYHQ